MNAQEAFDTIARHLFAQGRRASNTEGSCYYRMGGLKCAIGALIPDNMYDEGMENNTIDCLCEKEELREITEQIFGGIFPEQQEKRNNFLTALQRVHDHKENWKDTLSMQVALERAALVYNLEPGIVKTLAFAAERDTNA